ncbi:MAG TPA: VOC family protein [Candidatus Angelobacter sp.]|jgi:PhnB protein|nr:VOC family protein [Candidatus Angelobacter sp.]
MQLNPYLTFDGRCEEAFKFYSKSLGGKIEAIMTHAGTPAEQHVPAEMRDKVMHARMTIDGQVLMASDALPGHYQPPKGISISLQIKEVKEAERAFNALAENGTIQMPIQETFWAQRFGMVTDQFGIPWMINCEKAA